MSSILDLLREKRAEAHRRISPPANMTAERLERWNRDPYPYHRDDAFFYGQWDGLNEAIQDIESLGLRDVRNDLAAFRSWLVLMVEMEHRFPHDCYRNAIAVFDDMFRTHATAGRVNSACGPDGLWVGAPEFSGETA